MVDWSNLDLEDVVQESYHLEYASKVGSLFVDLNEIKHNLSLVEKVLQLPFRVIVADDPSMIFFSSFVDNALNINIMSINRLITNTGSMNLLRFRNSLLRETKPEYQLAYRERLRNTQLDPSLNSIIADMARRRNEMVAHNENMTLWAGDVSEHLLTSQQTLFAEMERAFQAVIFAKPPIKSIFEPEDVDIDSLLNCAARNSALINMPEQDNERWPNIKNSLDQTIIEKINRFRFRLGLGTA